MYHGNIGDNFGKWKILNCTENAFSYMCKKRDDGASGGIQEKVVSDKVDKGSSNGDPNFPYEYNGHKYAVSSSEV